MYVLLMIAFARGSKLESLLLNTVSSCFVVDSLEIRSICTLYARDLWCLYSLSLLSLPYTFQATPPQNTTGFEIEIRVHLG